jgi:hypothetical protein
MVDQALLCVPSCPIRLLSKSFRRRRLYCRLCIARRNNLRCSSAFALRPDEVRRCSRPRPVRPRSCGLR